MLPSMQVIIMAKTRGKSYGLNYSDNLVLLIPSHCHFYLSLILEIYEYVTAISGHCTAKTNGSLDTACALPVWVRCKASKKAVGF